MTAKSPKIAEEIAMKHLAQDWGEASTEEDLKAFKARRNKAYQSNGEFGSSEILQEDMQESIDGMSILKGRRMLEEVFVPIENAVQNVCGSFPSDVVSNILSKKSGISTYYIIFEADFDAEGVKQHRWSIRAGSSKEVQALMEWYIHKHQLDIQDMVILKSKDALKKLFTSIDDEVTIDNDDNNINGDDGDDNL